MPKFYVTQSDTYEIFAESMEEAKQIWRTFTIDGTHGEEIDFIYGSAEYSEEE